MQVTRVLGDRAMQGTVNLAALVAEALSDLLWGRWQSRR
jgi:hypothetical protein